ncbi:3'(2'),5'-bisphosphate nucleotidase CysQ family protein [Neptuniibacter sp. QD48_11]|uniref:3'(2'),5'-bisphosphate nucleotidase CysQ family protein n=1 Tax=unclassified Neptuniibacter TaxID=2630693 RepID=UPI0039F50893
MIEFERVVSLVINTGNEIKRWRKSDEFSDITDKRKFKTDADSMAHGLIVAGLADITRDISVVSEEDEVRQRGERYWLIDPIDGTASWYHGFSGYVCQVALIDNGQPTFGVIYAPERNDLWVGQRGKGATYNGQPVKPARKDKPIRSIIDNTPEPHGIAKYLYDALGLERYVECGSLGLKSVLVCNGEVDLFVKDVVVRDWDLAPVAAIANELNYYIYDINGKRVCFEQKVEEINGLIISPNLSLIDKVVRLTKTAS